MKILDYVERVDARTKKQIDDLAEKDELAGKENRYLRSEDLREFKL
jgi:hypothetical protein